MQAASFVPESQQSFQTIDLNDPRLTTEIIHLDPNAVPLQHGLIYDSEGRVQVKPEIAADTCPDVLALINRLLAAGRRSEANSIAGCRHIMNVTSYCEHNHEAEYGATICQKPLLHQLCSIPRSRVAKFAYEHPDLHAHVLRSVFQVLTFTIPDCTSHAAARTKFTRFVAALDLDEFHGWQWLWAYADQGVAFYAIHEGGRLPYWPELNALWHRIAGPSATLHVRTFDGRDGDNQRDGLLLANSGFRAYWAAVEHGDVDPLVYSLMMCGEDLTTLYGAFRGFKPTIADNDTANAHDTVLPAPPELPICLQCGKRHVAAHGTIQGTKQELGKRFDHIRPTSYGQRQARGYRIPSTASPVAASPPPW